MAMHPEVAAGLIGIGMFDMLRATARVAVDAGAERAARASYTAWNHALAAARDDANEIASVTVTVIAQIGVLEDKIASLEEENAHLRRALQQRDRALQNRRQ